MIKDIPRIYKPTVEEFMRNYVDLRQPVVIEGGLDQWGAKDWTLPFLKRKLGAKKFTYRTEQGRKEAVLSEMLEQIEKSTETNPAVYLRNIDIHNVLPELSEDIPTLKYMENNWRDHWAWPERWPYYVRRNLVELFISGPGVSFPRLHIDYWAMDAFVAQLHGYKDFILYPIEDAPYLYVDAEDPLISTVDDFTTPNFDKYPKLAQASQYRVRLGPGDLLYNPAWWHTTLTLETSITVIMAYYHRRNYPAFVQEIERVYRKCNFFKTTLIVQYFRTLGWLKMMFEK